MKRNVSVVCVYSAPNCCDTEQRSASQPGSVASGTLFISLLDTTALILIPHSSNWITERLILRSMGGIFEHSSS
jgi:hypothetical protein